MEGKPARARLLDAVIDHFSEAALGEQSLRRIAGAVGTSHRMLLYHFGSKDGLLLAVAQEVEARARRLVAEIGEATAGATDELIRRVWASVSDPSLAPFERLFFALYGRALQGDPALTPLLESDLSAWLDANVALAAASGAGVPRATVRMHARLGLAVVRGLLLDLLATGDTTAVDAAFEAYARRYTGAWWEDQLEGDELAGGAVPIGSGSSDRAS